LHSESFIELVGTVYSYKEDSHGVCHWRRIHGSNYGPMLEDKNTRPVLQTSVKLLQQSSLSKYVPRELLIQYRIQGAIPLEWNIY